MCLMCQKRPLVHFVWRFHIFANLRRYLLFMTGAKSLFWRIIPEECRLLGIILGHVPRAYIWKIPFIAYRTSFWVEKDNTIIWLVFAEAFRCLHIQGGFFNVSTLIFTVNKYLRFLVILILYDPITVHFYKTINIFKSFRHDNFLVIFVVFRCRTITVKHFYILYWIKSFRLRYYKDDFSFNYFFPLFF